MHFLIAYKYLPDHPDPLFEEFTYGDVKARAKRLKTSLKEGDYIFFHTGANGKKFITAYYVVDRVLDTETVIENKALLEEYKNPHISRYLSGRGNKDDIIIFGNPSKSRILKREEWLLFDRFIIEKLSLNIKFSEGFSENQAIVSGTRAQRVLADEDVKIILDAINEQVITEKYPKIVCSEDQKVCRSISSAFVKKVYEKPDWLLQLISDIDTLRNDREHKERAHESLVESFYGLLGFKKFDDIKHRQGRIDISVEIQGKTVIVNEVKKDWHLSYRDKSTIIQAYNYSLESGARFVVITNGDYYAIFDKDKGRSYEANFIGDFQLTKLEKEDLKLIEFLRKQNISSSL